MSFQEWEEEKRGGLGFRTQGQKQTDGNESKQGWGQEQASLLPVIVVFSPLLYRRTRVLVYSSFTILYCYYWFLSFYLKICKPKLALGIDVRNGTVCMLSSFVCLWHTEVVRSGRRRAGGLEIWLASLSLT